MPDLVSFALWYLAVTAAGLAALPLTFRLFRFLPDRGYALARPLGLLTAGYAFWLLGSLGFLRNDAPSVWVAAGLVLAAGLAGLRRAGLAELRAWLKANAGYALGVEALFLLGLTAWTMVRAYSPEIVATEKPMEFMFINAILRSPAFPPNDAWLAGHAISYYYFGYVLIAALIKVTGIASAVAFNLGLALLFALTLTGACGIAVNLIALVKANDHPPSAIRQAFLPALLAPLLIAVAGNFYGGLRLAHDNGWLAGAEVPAVYYDFGDQAAGRPPSVRVDLVNVWQWLDIKGTETPPAVPAASSFNWDPGYWWWFYGARITHDRNLVGQETEAITEMPAFSFVLGDMHPHVLGLPFVFLALGVALNWLLLAGRLPPPTVTAPAAAPTPDIPAPDPASSLLSDPPSASGYPPSAIRHSPSAIRHSLIPDALLSHLQPLIPDLLLTAVILGGLAFLNTWDFPIYLFVVTAAFALGLGQAWGWEGLVRGWLRVAGFAGGVAMLGIGLYLPFYLTFQSQAGGILPNLIYPTRFQQTVVMFGPALAAALLYLGWLTRRAGKTLDRGAALWAGAGLLGFLISALLMITLAASLNPALASFVDGFLAPLSRGEALGLLVQRRLVDSFTTLLPALMLGLCAGLAVGALRRSRPAGAAADLQSETPAAQSPITNYQSLSTDHQPLITNPPPLPASSLFTLLLIATGALLLLGPEFVYLRDNFGTRMNTIFKFYFQTWVLWGAAGAFGLWQIAHAARRWVAWTARGVAGLAIAAGLLYTGPAVWSRAGHFAGQPTLDGMAYFAQQYPDDWAAIQWLQANVAGAPVIAEGIGGQYWIEGRFSRISMATGLPTVMGWPGHEAQWRGRAFDAVAEREDQIRQLYQVRDTATARDILTRYNIQYVIVSDLEHQKYGAFQTAKFEALLRPVFQAGNVIIYQRRAAP